MKKIILAIFVISFVLFGCTGKKEVDYTDPTVYENYVKDSYNGVKDKLASEIKDNFPSVDMNKYKEKVQSAATKNKEAFDKKVKDATANLNADELKKFYEDFTTSIDKNVKSLENLDLTDYAKGFTSK